MEAERAFRSSRERPFAETCLSCESIVHILYYEIKDVFKHITVSLGSKTVSCFGTTKGCR